MEANIPHQLIYSDYCQAYDQLRSRMDHHRNLIKEISALVDVKGLNIVELAAGTGKLTELLAPSAKRISAFDLSAEMIAFAQHKFLGKGYDIVSFGVADNMHLPCPNASAELVIEGWSLGYVAYAAGDDWHNAIEKVLFEMERILRPGGTAMILGTLGTGAHDPKPPNKVLADLYAHLENEHGFSRSPWFKTDYKFDDIEEAVRLTSFFWSDKFGSIVKERNLIELPECTAIWYKHKI